MAANDLASNPLYDTEDNDDDDRRLATTSFMPRTRKEPGQGPAKKKASGGGGGAKLFGSTGGGIKLNGGKMFGNFDVGAMVGADELEFNHQKSNYEHTGMIDESEFVIDALTERRKKEMIWNSSPVPRHRENLEKKSIEKHEEMVLKENEAKFLNGILNQALVFDEKEEIEIVITNDNKPTQANPTQPNGTQQITSRFSSKVYGGSSHISGGTSVLESQLQLQRQQKNTESGVFQFKSQFSQSILGLKRGSKLEDIPIRDRNDLKKVLTKSVFERRKLATEEEVLRSTKISDFCQKNDQDDGDQSSRSESGNPMDIERAGSKLATSEMVALEEEGYDEDAEGSIHEDEEGYDEVRKEIERVEQLVLSDDEEGDQNAIEESQDADQDGVSAKNSGMQKIKNQVEDSDSEDEGSNYLDDEADEEEDDASQSNEGSQSLNGNGIEAEEDTNPQPAMRRLKKVRDVKAAKKAEKRERRDIRRAQFYQIEKEKRKAFKTNDIYDDEADLGEIVDGKDAGLKNINVFLSLH